MTTAIAGAILLSQNNAYAQNETDALRYSWNGTPGTARSLGMGGAFGALGADHSAFWNNPAGLAVYKRNAAELTLGHWYKGTGASYAGETSETDRSRLYMPSFGYVATKEHEGDVRTFIGIGLGTLTNFNQNIQINGTVDGTTLLDVFARQANGVPYDQVSEYYPFGAGLAWDAYLIDPLDTLNNTYVPVAFGNGIKQSKNIQRSGRHFETTMAFGAAIQDKLYLGATIGFQSISFQEYSTYSETFTESTVLNNFTYKEDLYAGGNGVNLRLGALYRPTDWLRVGAAFQSRTKLEISESYNTSMHSQFVDGDRYDEFSEDLISNYNVRTPAKWMVNAAFVMGKAGVISADYEYTNYSRIRMSSSGLSSDYNYAAENEAIRENYESTHKAKIGAEFRLADAFRLRGGVIYQQSPFVQGASETTPILTYTGGVGYRKNNFFVDLAVNYRKDSEWYWLYDPRLVDKTKIENTVISSMLSIGFKYN